jgi:hypothetical protein
MFFVKIGTIFGYTAQSQHCYEIPARTSCIAVKHRSEVSALLYFTALWRRAGKLKKILDLMHLQSHIYKNIPVSFDFITT